MFVFGAYFNLFSISNKLFKNVPLITNIFTTESFAIIFSFFKASSIRFIFSSAISTASITNDLSSYNVFKFSLSFTLIILYVSLSSLTKIFLFYFLDSFNLNINNISFS